MGRIRVIGTRRDRGRCPYCRDSLDALTATCPECNTTTHLDCLEELDRCPTHGCAGRPAGVTGGGAVGSRAARQERRERRARHRERRQDPGPWVLEHWATEERRRQRPGPTARFGPFLRLFVSGALSALVILATLAAFVWLLLFAVPQGLDLEGGCTAMIVGSAFSMVCGKWLSELPHVWNSARRLLEENDPLPMRMTVTRTAEGKNTQYWLTLSPESESEDVPEHRIQLGGVLPPWWVMYGGHVRTAVLVYGARRRGGPFLIEMGDGRLAIVHPD